MVLSAFVNKVFLTISILTLLILQMKLILTIIFPSEIKNETKIYKKYYILLKRNNFSKNEKRLIKLYIRLISTLS